MVTTPAALLRRARRSAKSLVGGEALLEALQSEPYLEAMRSAVVDEMPPVARVSKMLLQDFASFTPAIDFKALTIRQFIGSAVRAILAQENYSVLQSGVKIPDDPIFRTGATYQKNRRETHLLDRFVPIFVPEERYALVLTKDELAELRLFLYLNDVN